MVKKSTKSSKTTPKKHVSHNQSHIMLRKSIALYVVILFLGFILVSLSAFTVIRTYETYHDNKRLDKITKIYEDINLGDKYRLADSYVFGDKRVYDEDKGRTFSSSVEYGYNETPIATLKDLTKKITATGFNESGSAYEGSTAPQYYFKNDDGNYIRVTVESAKSHARTLYGVDNGADLAKDSKGPTYVTIKVNLDDNNE